MRLGQTIYYLSLLTYDIFDLQQSPIPCKCINFLGKWSKNNNIYQRNSRS